MITPDPFKLPCPIVESLGALDELRDWAYRYCSDFTQDQIEAAPCEWLQQSIQNAIDTYDPENLDMTWNEIVGASLAYFIRDENGELINK